MFKIHSRNCSPKNRGLVWMAVMGLCCLGLRAQAQESIHFTAQVNPTTVVVGAPIRFTLVLETEGTRVNAEPTIKDWGGLTLRGGPVSSRNTSVQIINGAQSVKNYQTFEYQLAAPRAGRYTVPSAQVAIGGKTYASQPVVIEAGTRPPANVPVQFQGESIISAQTNDPDINQQLDGRLFLRVAVSNKSPWVREPVIITCTVYVDGLTPPSQYEFAPGDIQGAVSTPLYPANNAPIRLSYQTVDVGGKQYKAATVYRMALTPTKSGKLTLDGMGMKVVLPVRRQGGGDPFGMFDDPFFGGGIQALLPTTPLDLDVRPLPTAGQPANFTGTVGDFTLAAEADRAQLTEDDLVTLRLTLAGKGNIDLAYQPAPPKLNDFQVVGQSAKETEKKNTTEGLGGSRRFEIVLRPTRSGDLQIPEIHYPVFNPATGRYVDLATKPIPLKVAPGKSPMTVSPATPGAGAAGSVQQPEELHWLHSIGPVPRRRPEPLLESFTFWMLQLAAAGLVLGAWKRNRRLATQDPAHVRRSGAWRGFERRLRVIRQQKAGQPQEVAGQVDQAARMFIADRFNLSPDGLTRIDIERLLRERSVPETRVQRLCDLLEHCETLRYAPLGSVDGELNGWIDEIVTIFKENLHE